MLPWHFYRTNMGHTGAILFNVNVPQLGTFTDFMFPRHWHQNNRSHIPSTRISSCNPKTSIQFLAFDNGHLPPRMDHTWQSDSHTQIPRFKEHRSCNQRPSCNVLPAVDTIQTTSVASAFFSLAQELVMGHEAELVSRARCRALRRLENLELRVGFYKVE